MKKELSKKAIEVRRKSDKMMAMVLVFEEEVIRVICAYAPQVGSSKWKNDQFYNDIASEWDLQNFGEVTPGLGDFNGHVGRRFDGFEGVHGEYGIGKRNVE